MSDHADPPSSSTPWMIARNPANGEELGRWPATPPSDVAAIVARASIAQKRWASEPWRERLTALRQWHRILARDSEIWAGAIRDEIGKPAVEGMVEVVATLDGIRWTIGHARKSLADERIGPSWQRFLLLPPARLHWAPLGTIGIIGTWNYPLLLNAPPIAQALAAGNAVVWKPSELAVGLGRRLQDSIDEAGFPPGLVSELSGDAEVGLALVRSGIAKALFTGGTESGRVVLAELGRLGVPATAELSGFDPAIILPDAPLESTTRALAWASFVAAGQTCVAVKRIYTVGDPTRWAESLASRADSLRVGDPASGAVDVGPMISRSARDRFHATIGSAVEAGARILAGGRPVDGPGSFYRPTVLIADGPGPESILAGCFGPLVLVRGVPDVDSAVEAANAGRYGLSASVWGRDRRLARNLAGRLEAGMVAINEAVTTAAHASAPFGGCKASGFGRTRGAHGLRELARPMAIHDRSPGGFRPHLFPYGGPMLKIFEVYRRCFHPKG